MERREGYTAYSGEDLIVGIAVYDPDGEHIGSKATNTGGADLTYTLRGLQSDGVHRVRFSGTWGTTGWEVDSYGDYDTQGPYTFQVRNLDVNGTFAGNHSIDDAAAYGGGCGARMDAALGFYRWTPTMEFV